VNINELTVYIRLSLWFEGI